MTEEEQLTMFYRIDGENIEPGEAPTFPVEILVTCNNVEAVKPSALQLRLSHRPLVPQRTISINAEDVEDVTTFYINLHHKIVALPSNNKFFIFADTQAWSGFVTCDDHVKYIASHKSSIVIAILNDTYFERAIKYRNRPTIPENMSNFLRQPLPQQSQASRVTTAMQHHAITTFQRLREGAENREIFDIPQERSSMLSILHDDPYITLIPITPKFKQLFIALNSTLTAMDLHLYPRNRTLEVDEEIVKNVIITVIQEHIPHNESSESSESEEQNEEEENDE